MKLAGKLEAIKASIAALGFVETVKAGLVLLLSYNPAKDRAFDQRFKTETSSIVPVGALGIGDADKTKSAVFYISAPVRFERYIIGALNIDYKDFHFVDVGCGKGRVLMLASEWPFHSITGIEISKALCEIAERNVQVYSSRTQKCRNIAIQCMDATQFPIEEKNTVYHFYHPFQVDVLKPILERIASRFQQSDKKVYIAYIWMQLPDLFSLFDSLGFKRLRHIETLNRRYQCAVFSI
jgi:SAM-dependent methyltransferase